MLSETSRYARSCCSGDAVGDHAFGTVPNISITSVERWVTGAAPAVGAQSHRRGTPLRRVPVNGDYVYVTNAAGSAQTLTYNVSGYGVIEIGMGTQVTFASFAAGNNNGGDIQIANSSTMTISTEFPNSGTIELEGPAAALNGGAIANTGSITGQGRISNAVLNSGVVESRPAGLLQISAAGSTNLAGAQIIADAGTTVQYSQGLSTNAGTITLAGGTFDNNSRAMINTGVINGSGSFRTGGAGLNNSAGAIIDVTAGTSFFGPVSNSGYITSYGSTNTFYSNVTDASGGTIKVTNGTVYFLGNPGATVSGSYNSDPSDNYFNTLATTSTGTVIGGSGDRFLLINGTTFTNAGTFHNTRTLSAASVANSGSFLQTGTLAETGNFTNSGTASIGGNQNWSQGTLFTNTAGTATFESDAGSLGSENLSVSVTGGSVLFTSTLHILALNISNGAIAIVTGNGNGNRSLICAAALSDAGTLDLTGNDLDVQSGGTAALATVNTLIAHGYANGTWTGTGITSSAAANDSSHLTAVGVLLNTAGGTMPLYTSLDGATVAENDVLVKGTYYGDANLDGKVDGSDYSRIDNGYLSRLTGWFNGDFNYDSFINGSDYTLIDNAFNTQGAQLDATFADASEARTAQIAGIASVPEPGAFLFLSAGIHMLLGRSRRMLGSSRDRELSLALRKT